MSLIVDKAGERDNLRRCQSNHYRAQEKPPAGSNGWLFVSFGYQATIGPA